ncbi:MAG: aldehyde dehydrogenase family protein [Betaproteobacteria bacterium]|nr:aldehyde dehydrogenase family protein [Betaproteobacteria bacterium]
MPEERNFPLYQIIAKIAPALALGCTVVLKSSSVGVARQLAIEHPHHGLEE